MKAATRKRIRSLVRSSIALTLVFLLVSTSISSPKEKYSRHLKSDQSSEPMLDGQKKIYRFEETLAESNTILLGIFSMASIKAAAKRDLIRQTYIKEGGRQVCSLKEYEDMLASRSKDEIECRVIYTFVLGGGTYAKEPLWSPRSNEPISLPQHKNWVEVEDDCTYLNIRENMNNGKSITYLAFASMVAEKLDIDYVAKIDDDTVTTIPLVIEKLNDLPPSPFNRRIYGGLFTLKFSRMKYENHHLEILYSQGQFYYMSKDLARFVGSEMPFENYYRLRFAAEDAAIGSYILTHERPITIIDDFPSVFWRHPAKSVEDYKSWWDRREEEGILPFAHKHDTNYKWFCEIEFPGHGMVLQ